MHRICTTRLGQVYRQEFSLGNSEDSGEVLSNSYRNGEGPELDECVPQTLADLLCGAGDCGVTRDCTPIEPGTDARKYYARGMGPFLEVVIETGETLHLVDCNVDPRCAVLPEP